MDGIANVARQQQSHVGTTEAQGKTQEQSQQAQNTVQTKQSNIIKEMQNSTVNDTKKLDSKENIEDLVKELNNALSPLHTNIKFGVDRDDIFYVAAIDTKTDKIIRRFPAAKAQEFLPKMQEVSGILFDSKG